MTSDPPLTLATEEETALLRTLFSRLRWQRTEKASRQLTDEVTPVLGAIAERHGGSPSSLVVGLYMLDFKRDRLPRVHVAIAGQEPVLPGIDWTPMQRPSRSNPGDGDRVALA